MLPSVVTTIPMVEWSLITFLVPISAAWVNGISTSDQGVFTSRSASSSMWPAAPSTIKPTQSTRRTFTFTSPPSVICAASWGMNLGSVVVIVFPPELCGSSSCARMRSASSVIYGSTSRSINRLIKVDFPVRTGPTTPM